MFNRESNNQTGDWDSGDERQKILKCLNEIATSDDEEYVSGLHEAMSLVILEMNAEGMTLLDVKERDMLDHDKKVPDNVRRRIIKRLSKSA